MNINWILSYMRAVSYTHLDVYKRQEEEDLGKIFQSRGVSVEIKKVEAVEDGARVRKL